MILSTTGLYIIVTLVTVVLLYCKQHFSYWKRRGIPHIEPHPIEGNLRGFKKNRSLRVIFKDYYDQFKGTGLFAGFFFFQRPTVFVLDLDLARNILVKDFHNFTDRGFFYNEKDDPLSAHIFALDGAKWKDMRVKLTPSFTSGKMKFMFPTVLSVGERFTNALEKMTFSDPIIDMKDMLARLIVDVIGTVAFGIECNSLQNPDCKFKTIGGKALTITRHNKIVDGLIFSFPKLARKLRMRQIHEEIHQFFMGMVRDTVDYREKNSIQRNDFMNLMIEAKNVKGDLTLNEVAAQAFAFFLAGFDSTSTTLAFAVYELAINQEVQDKLRAEINEHLEKNNGQFKYESMTEMHYMEKVQKEVLRKYPFATMVVRKSLKEYQTSDAKYRIPGNTMIFIPVDAIQRDPDIYPDPERFDPERFCPEEIQKRHPMAWIPFADGPRNCIGLRFAKMQMCVALSLLLRRFKLHACEKTPKELKFHVDKTLLSTEGEIFLRLERIE